MGKLRININGIATEIDAIEALGCPTQGRTFLRLPSDAPIGVLTVYWDSSFKQFGIPFGVLIGNQDSVATDAGVYVRNV